MAWYDYGTPRKKNKKSTTYKRIKEEDKNLPNWLNVNNVRQSNKDISGKLQHNRDNISSNNINKSIGQYKRKTRRVRKVCKSEHRKDQPEKIENLEERTWNKRRKIIRISLQDLRDSLSDKELKLLLSNEFDKDKKVIIKQTIKIRNEAPEDKLLPINKNKVIKIKATPTKRIKPSESFDAHIKNYEKGIVSANAKIVLGYYFKGYKKLFGEEDPYWSGRKDFTHALILVNKLAEDTTNNDYKSIIDFVRRILPLWHRRLVNNESFPENRPTLQHLLAGKRYYWANRKLLYRQWQKK